MDNDKFELITEMQVDLISEKPINTIHYMNRVKEKQSYCHKVGSPKANTETEFGILNIYQESRSVEGREESRTGQRGKLNYNTDPTKPPPTSREPSELFYIRGSPHLAQFLEAGCSGKSVSLGQETGNKLAGRSILLPACSYPESKSYLKAALAASLHISYTHLNR